MTNPKRKRPTAQLIVLGIASRHTKGSIGTQIPDGSLMQFREPILGLSAD